MSLLVGRTTEIEAAVEVVAGQANDVAVLIEGPPGIGKTVVLDAALDAARTTGALVLEARPSEAESRMPLLALHDLFDPVLAETVRTLPEAQRVRLEAAMGVGPSTEGDSPDEGRLAIAVMAGLRGLAVRRRLVIAIDDLQWLDPSTASVLEVALARLQRFDVRLIASAREDGDGDRPRPIERLYRDRLARIRLAGLTLGAMHRLLTERLGRSVPRPTLIRVHEISEGNPFHALELTRSLAGGERRGASLSDAVPADLGALLRGRILSLPGPSREVVDIVALSPRPSNETVARALDIEIAELEQRSAAPIEAGLLMDGTRGLALAHPLVGSAARLILGPAKTRAVHRRLADVVTDPDEVAVHLSLGTTQPDEDVAMALEAAARRGLARGATVDAIDQMDRTIRLTPDGHDDALVRRRLLLVRALVLAGDTRRAGTELDALNVDGIGDPSMRAEAVLLLGIVQRYLGEHAAALRRHEDALQWVTDGATRARLRLRLAYLNEHDLRASLDHATNALALLDPDKAPLDYSFALLLAARLRLHLGLEADHEAIARGAALQADAGEWDWNLSTTPIDWATWMDDWDRARALLDAGARAAELAGDETVVGALLRRRIEVETWSGELERAAELVDTALEQAESTQQLPSIASAKARRALLRAHMGDLEAADAEAAEAYALADGLNIPPIRGYAATAVAAAALGRRDFERIDDVVSRATASLDATGDVDQSAHRFHADHLEALIALGELDRARALADRLRRRGELGPRPTWSGVAARGYAAIAVAEGRLEVAQERMDEALRFHAPARVPLETARTLMAAAELDRRLGRRKSAAARLTAALDILVRIGAAGMAAAARAGLERLAPDRAEGNVLTPSEERIATLASEGLRNRDIARRLAISEKTVEAALSRAYDKLGIRSRAQLAVGLAQSRERVERPTS